MPFFTTVLYPAEGNFNLDHFFNVHMPKLAMKHWKQYGLMSYELTKFDTTGEQKPTYSVQVIFKWDKLEGVEKALSSPEAEEVITDVKNFTSIMGTVIGTGEIVGSG